MASLLLLHVLLNMVKKNNSQTKLMAFYEFQFKIRRSWKNASGKHVHEKYTPFNPTFI